MQVRGSKGLVTCGNAFLQLPRIPSFSRASRTFRAPGEGSPHAHVRQRSCQEIADGTTQPRDSTFGCSYFDLQKQAGQRPPGRRARQHYRPCAPTAVSRECGARGAETRAMVALIEGLARCAVSLWVVSPLRSFHRMRGAPPWSPCVCADQAFRELEPRDQLRRSTTFRTVCRDKVGTRSRASPATTEISTRSNASMSVGMFSRHGRGPAAQFAALLAVKPTNESSSSVVASHVVPPARRFAHSTSRSVPALDGLYPLAV